MLSTTRAGLSTFGGSGFTGDGGLATFLRAGISNVCGGRSGLAGDGSLSAAAGGGGAEAATLVSTGVLVTATAWGGGAATGVKDLVAVISVTDPSGEYICSRSKSGTLLSFPPNHSEELRPGLPLGAGG